jgi:hypothetical protein
MDAPRSLLLLGYEQSKMRGICFETQKLLTTVRIQAGEPDILVRKVSPRCSTQELPNSWVLAQTRWSHAVSAGEVDGRHLAGTTKAPCNRTARHVDQACADMGRSSFVFLDPELVVGLESA